VGDEEVNQKYEISEAQAEEIRTARWSNKDKRVDLRLHALELRAQGKSNGEIAQYLHVNAKVVSRWVSRYIRNGLEDMMVLRYGGNHRNLSYKEEEAFLARFEETAEKGQIIVIGEMKQAYDKQIGHHSGHETIYRLLKRHTWRKVMPRSKHPKKACDSEIQTAKNKIFVG
jgi:transposase